MIPIERLGIDLSIVTIICFLTKGLSNSFIWKKIPEKLKGLILFVPVILGIAAAYLFFPGANWRETLKTACLYGFGAAYAWKVGLTGKEITTKNTEETKQ
jgi:hypothetical protein